MAVLLYEHERPLVAYATRLLHGDQERGRDAVQEVFLRLFRQDVIDGLGRAWLFTATRRVCIDTLRKESRMAIPNHGPGGESGIAGGAHVPAGDPGPDEVLERAERQDQVARAVDLLPDNQREALRLKFESGLSYAEIATVLGSTEGTVAWWLHAAVKSLRERLGTAFGDEAVGLPIGGGEA